ncbi:MAG: histidine--tRNA ligase [Vicinamibacterales bacterium]
MAGTQPARGMRDFLPDDVRRRAFVVDAIRRVYERYGFEPLETPAVENLETLLGKYGDEGNKLIFKILKRGDHEGSGEADLALRYDLTVPMARVIAEYHAKLPRFFKRYQIQPVWRADRPARGRFREFYQCDLDIIGTTSLMVEADVCAAVCDVLRTLGFPDFVLRLNHRQLLNAILDTAGVPADRHGDALVALDKWDKVGREGVAVELSARGVSSDAGSRLMVLFASLDAAEGEAGGDAAAREACNRAVLRTIEAFLGEHPGGVAARAELQDLLALCAQTPAAGHLRVDATLARGLSYYTGTIMEVSVPDLAGSLGGGGRYDRLVGMFLGNDVPACGFSLGLERIIVVMSERRMFPPTLAAANADVLVTLWNDEARADALGLACGLRAAGLRVDVYPDADRLGKQFKYASARAIAFVLVAGDDERARGEVAVKDLRKGTQVSVARADVAAHLRAAVFERAGADVGTIGG